MGAEDEGERGGCLMLGRDYSEEEQQGVRRFFKRFPLNKECTLAFCISSKDKSRYEACSIIVRLPHSVSLKLQNRPRSAWMEHQSHTERRDRGRHETCMRRAQGSAEPRGETQATLARTLSQEPHFGSFHQVLSEEERQGPLRAPRGSVGS